MIPGGFAVSAQGADLRQVTQSTHFRKGCLSVRLSLSLGWKSEPHEVASCSRWSWQAVIPLAGSVLEAWGADMGLVEGVCGVKHFWRRLRARQDGAERFVGAQHRGKVLHLLRQLLDLPAKRSVLPLQVFALLKGQNHRGFHITRVARMSWGRGVQPRGSAPQSFRSGMFPVNPARSRAWANPPPPSSRGGRDAGGPATLPGPGLREVAAACSRPGFLAPSHAPAASRAARPGGGLAE